MLLLQRQEKQDQDSLLPLPMKNLFCGLKAFNLCLGDIYFKTRVGEGRTGELLHLLGCNNSI